MIEQITITVIILISSLLIMLPFKKRTNIFNKNSLLAGSYHLSYVILIFIPISFSFLSIPNTEMNWAGKILALLFSIVFYFLVKNYLKDNDFILSLPIKKSRRKVIIVGLVTVIFMAVLTMAFSRSKPLNTEILFYQMTMPGIDEELWRGILLGLLIPIIKNSKFKLGHPAIWATTLIFALGHSLFLQNWELQFAIDAFIITGILGYILGWMTYYSKSILPAIIFHNLINFSTNFIEMFFL
ncbi:CPBP family intramembrane metalloprotease [Polaribacter batillariae]|uniref:CPBP family intramembrane metalloprotease n=1 Tax=Polaribacter batillariae TaxID=2808900 RepID=A0ABX7SZ07_9FLAO|nr:CPBP family intramembrane glutamic endopeptidase [Polaribacter batillariae]QTD38068.1 CPBP family intramembrane metalloprotease [Polaribacter batillariae]